MTLVDHVFAGWSCCGVCPWARAFHLPVTCLSPVRVSVTCVPVRARLDALIISHRCGSVACNCTLISYATYISLVLHYEGPRLPPLLPPFVY